MSSFLLRGRSRSFLALGASLLIVGSALVVRAQDAPSTTAWTTYKGDNQRSGSSAAKVTLPLSLQWRYSSTAPARSSTTAALVLGAPGRRRIYFSGGRKVFCLDAQTGAPAEGWTSVDTTSNIVGPITLLAGPDGDLILVPQQNSRLTALRATDGGLAWETDTQGQLSNSGCIVVPTKNGPRVVTSSNTGLIGLDATGAPDPEWNILIPRFDISTPLTLSQDGSTILFLNGEGRLMAIDTREHKINWTNQQPTRVGATPTVTGKYVITANARRVTAYEVSGGAEKWNFDPKGDVRASPAVHTFDGTNLLYFGTASGDFYAVDAKDGSQKWMMHLDTSFTGTPLVLNNVVLAGTKGGTLIGFEPSNGKVLWNYRLNTKRDPNAGTGQAGGRRGGRRAQAVQGNGTGGGNSTAVTYAVTDAPAAVDGQVYVLGDNAALYAFTSSLLDSDPPRLVEPSIALPNDQNVTSAQLLPADKPPLVPGKGPFYFATQLDDAGSGVDPDSIKISMDGVELDSKAWSYDPISGVLTVVLLEGDGKTFDDGTKQIGVTLSDYAGNKTNYSGSFLIDNTVAPPSSRPNRRGNRGGGNRGGGLDNGGDNGDNGGGGLDNGGDNGDNGGGGFDNGGGLGDNGGGPGDNGGDNGGGGFDR